MLSRMLPISLLVFSAIAFEPGAYASNKDQRVSVTGAVFTLDISKDGTELGRVLGEAYRDPSGLIWGSIVMDNQGSVKNMNQLDAQKYCEDGGARLPTLAEFRQLTKHFGQAAAYNPFTGDLNGYNPFLADGKTDVLPGFSNHQFWSSTFSNQLHGEVFLFSGNDGFLGGTNRVWGGEYAVRCVVD